MIDKEILHMAHRNAKQAKKEAHDNPYTSQLRITYNTMREQSRCANLARLFVANKAASLAEDPKHRNSNLCFSIATYASWLVPSLSHDVYLNANVEQWYKNT